MEEIKEKAILVGVNVDNEDGFENSMKELEALSFACNIEVVGTITQNLDIINRAIYLGKGKLEELNFLVDDKDVDVVIFNNELSPSQLRNLQKNLDVAILDKTSLILQIFARRAKSKEAKLQVEVAKMQYMLPRLVGLHSSLGRQGGGSGLSNKGSGEKKLELDKRKIEDRIVELNKELKDVTAERQIQRRQREESEIPLVSLVGYTNAGKSTIMNMFVDDYVKDDKKKVFEENMLFATLDTSIRKIVLEDKRNFLLSDTVGFIRGLPHSLVKAFRSTLEEIQHADLILHVVDYSDPNYLEHIETTNETLKEIGVTDKKMIYVFNKSEEKLSTLPIIKEDIIYMSAKTRQGEHQLIEMICKEIFRDLISCKLLIPFDKGNVLSYLNDNAIIKETEYLEEGTKITVECKRKDYEKYKEFLILVD